MICLLFRSALALLVVLAVSLPALSASESVFVKAGITAPMDIDRTPELFRARLQQLDVREAYNSSAIPPGGMIKTIEGNLRVAFLAGNDGRKYLMLASIDEARDQRVNITFTDSILLSEISHLTGLLRRRGNQTDWRMSFYGGEVKIFEWLPGSQEGPNPRPRVALNPSNQYANVINDEQDNQIYNEGTNMWLYAVKIKELLDRDGRVDAYITRRRQRQDMTLGWEMGITKMAKADALVALHSDATGNNTPGGGTWTFYKDEQGKKLASAVQTPVLDNIKAVYPEVQYRGIREHWSRLFVLHNSGCPASLTEILFHTNPKEREMLKDPAFQDRIARAFAEGILRYFGFEGLREQQ